MGVPRPTEMTVRDLLQEELQKRGVRVVPEFSVSAPNGRWMMSEINRLLDHPYSVLANEIQHPENTNARISIQ